MQTQAVGMSLPNLPVDAGMDENNSAMPNTADIPASTIAHEVSFVPAYQRQTLPNPQNLGLKDDTIVVVGQAGTRQRKRKRDKARVVSTSRLKSGTQSGGAETSASIGDHDQEVEEFDYSTVSNLLDDEGEHGNTRGMHEENERRKKKQRHGKGVSTFLRSTFEKKECERRMLRFLRGICFVIALA